MNFLSYLKHRSHYFLYKRVWSCFFLSFSLCFVLGLTTILLSLNNVGVNYEHIFGYNQYDAPSPIQIVAFSATFVTISLTLLGFALNNFSKRHKTHFEYTRVSSRVNNSVFEEATNVIFSRYRGVVKTLLCFNIFSFPLLAKALTLVLLLFVMFLHSFLGCYRIFYLCVYIIIMAVTIISILIEVFEIYSDINYTLFRACALVTKKIRKRLHFLYKTKNNTETMIVQILRNYASLDIYRSVLFISESLGTLIYLPLKFDKKLSIKFSEKEHTLLELLMCSELSPMVIFGIYDLRTELKDDTVKESFVCFVENTFCCNTNILLQNIEKEIKYVELPEATRYSENKEVLKELLQKIYDRIK